MSPSEGRAIRVLLVDDQQLIRAGLRGILRPSLGFTSSAEDLQRAVRAVAAGEHGLTPPSPELIATGMTNDEVAQRLVLGAGTIKTHVNHLFLKLGVPKPRRGRDLRV